MDEEKILHIRREEKRYHESFYENNKLFKKGSWLHKPVPSVLDCMSHFDQREEMKILDLGSGVGRNSIPLAEKIKKGQVVCVDILGHSLRMLKEYSKDYGVGEKIRTIQADIGDFPIDQNEYDFIVSVSALEHMKTEKDFDRMLHKMKLGTKPDGIHCFVINSQVEEIDAETNTPLDAFFEINLPTNKMIGKLKSAYRDWEVKQLDVKPLSFDITRNNQFIHIKTNAITFIAYNNKLESL
ncbi:class I SAM-dependent methyltransferase [Bacillus gobiensis]|uniref:class I SAM-dependent methyltransferase n=1 Tax=Bacillus gobiensis TaxID=1441095 RepID=UPI003D1FA62F